MRQWRKRGGVTVEFVTILPFCVLIALFIWQSAIFVLAMMHTEELLRDQARVAATTGEFKKVEKQGKKDFPSSDYYHLSKFTIKEKDKHIVAQAVTKVKIVFIPSKDMTYRGEKKTVVIH
ncbi:TadE/TadG family type IV pilus assembly protein [Salinithrix halophila]|uniref:TadE/TadG family type IV pilus assembly protein n=1 Tax=Salinithrix halophila TaxID=1485204 RepID=A0ABV8JCE5_9BACL